MSVTVLENQINESFCKKDHMVGLSFLQSMSDITAIVPNKEDKAYVHPIEKRSVSKLNEKSLEMCTESLGTETGSESGDELSLLALEATTTPRAPSPQPRRQEHEDTNLQARKSTMSRNNSFPPPIKFVEDSKYNRMVRWLGEDGRLVVQASRVPSPPRCFVAERGEGRLRLCLSSEGSLLRHNPAEEKEQEEVTEEGVDEEENSENLEGKNGNKKFSRLSSRCKEENGREPKPMLTWKQQQFWVAT
ncbi:PREDICTED: protein FANTASTIC FOUR 2-like [Camelina sativa]|uniref:Protein FANTASTIC FOUR 2-like n=1 Tax=Camelina sativa TaxID=90675 RepID=A0ABM0VJV3_CAMSA|nr:PREDICTED: protein FANTASTIC FOUR 2-like [Camelina sativa]